MMKEIELIKNRMSWQLKDGSWSKLHMLMKDSSGFTKTLCGQSIPKNAGAGLPDSGSCEKCAHTMAALLR